MISHLMKRCMISAQDIAVRIELLTIFICSEVSLITRKHRTDTGGFALLCFVLTYDIAK